MFKFGLDNFELTSSTGKIAIVTNSGSVNADLHSNIDLLVRMGADIVKILTPEHGFFGAEANGSDVDDSEYKGIPAVSLYGKKMKPEKSDLEDIDTVLFDLQDVGLRFYTYISTLYNVMEATAAEGISLNILDRPNPINANVIDGPVLEEENRSFVGPDVLPSRYGLTIGELALYFNRKIEGSVSVTKMSGYSRATYFDDIFNWFIPPSQNLPTLDSILNFAGLCIFEATDISLGRGTPYPFSQFGKPDLGSIELNVPGIALRKTKFRPNVDPYKDQIVEGYFIHVLDRGKYDPNLLALNLISELYRREFVEIDEKRMKLLYGSNRLVKFLEKDTSSTEIMESWFGDLEAFKDESMKYLLYS